MTCNELMVLLDCYRGTCKADRHMNTFQRDITYLVDVGLIRWSKDRPGWVTTIKGDFHCQRVLLISSDLPKS